MSFVSVSIIYFWFLPCLFVSMIRISRRIQIISARPKASTSTGSSIQKQKSNKDEALFVIAILDLARHQ
jgi:hypothetical protein